MEPINQIILSLREEPNKWIQTEYTLTHTEKHIEIWTENLQFFDIGIHKPKRKISFISKIKLQFAVNKWHKSPLVFDT